MKLNEKQKIIAVAAFFLAALGGAGALVFFKYRERSSLLGEIDGLEAKKVTANESIQKIPHLLEKKAELVDSVDKYVEILPPEEHVQHESFVEIVDAYRQDTQILIQKADPVKVNDDPKRKGAGERERFIRHRYRFSLLGTVPDFIEFLNKLENHPRFLKVDSFRIQPSRSRDGSDASESNPDAKELHAASNPIKEIELTVSTYTYFKGATEKKAS